MINASDPDEDDGAAQAALYPVGSPGAGTRMQIVGLEAELAALPSDANDHRLRIHHALAAHYGDLGDYRRALRHGEQELLLCRRVRGANHSDTLATRHNIAFWTGKCGHRAEALQLTQELLPDREQVLGRDHPDTLTTRSNIAFWTAECGQPAEALRLAQELLPDQERVLGRGHPHVSGLLSAHRTMINGSALCAAPAVTERD
jgi:hypothetical protein